MTVIENAVEGFGNYLKTYTDPELCGVGSVEEALYDWLSKGSAVADCRGSHEVFLCACAEIFAYHLDLALGLPVDKIIPELPNLTCAEESRATRSYGCIYDPYEWYAAVDARRERDNQRILDKLEGLRSK